MIGLDTNVLVRYLVQDDPRQSLRATRFIEQELSSERRGFVPLIVLCEVSWVLADCYSVRREKLAEIIEGLLSARQLKTEAPHVVWRALKTWHASRADFSDALIGAVVAEAGGERVVTFDRQAAKLTGFELLS